MSTRATYEFKQNDGISITFYVHTDGYPLGAKGKFLAMLDVKKKGSFIPSRLTGCFLIANKYQAEFTTSHDAHGDTEYQYTISTFKGEIMLEALALGHKWSFKGTLNEFLEQIQG